jgi:hypothetical protein
MCNIWGRTKVESRELMGGKGRVELSGDYVMMRTVVRFTLAY